MKVLFAALQYDYGRQENGLSVEYTNFFDALNHMNGVEAEFFPVDVHTKKLGRDGANNLLLEKVKTEKPDILFCYLLSEELKRGVIQQITRETSTKTFNWFADDHWRIPVFSRYWAPLFTLVSTTDSEAIAKYKQYGIANVIKTQWAANQHLYKPCPEIKTGKLFSLNVENSATFVGKRFGNRGVYIEALKQANLPVRTFGSGWPDGRLSQEEMLQTFSRSAINLNFSETHIYGARAKIESMAKLFFSKELGRYKFSGHHFLDNFRSLRGMRKKCIKGRVFEVIACGGFLISGSTDDSIDEYFEPGREMLVFKNKTDLVEKCRYYLNHPGERDKIAKAGYERTLKEHTYEQRFKKIFEVLGYSL